MDETPLSWKGLSDLGPILLVALLGGLVAFFQKCREGAARPFNFVEFIGEMATSGITGVFFYWLCRGFDVNVWVTAAVVGVSGHMSSRGLFMLEKWVEAKYNEWTLRK